MSCKYSLGPLDVSPGWFKQGPFIIPPVLLQLWYSATWASDSVSCKTINHISYQISDWSREYSPQYIWLHLNIPIYTCNYIFGIFPNDISWIFLSNLSQCLKHVSSGLVRPPWLNWVLTNDVTHLKCFNCSQQKSVRNNYPESLRIIWRGFHCEPALKEGYKTYIWYLTSSSAVTKLVKTARPIIFKMALWEPL